MKWVGLLCLSCQFCRREFPPTQLTPHGLSLESERGAVGGLVLLGSAPCGGLLH